MINLPDLWQSFLIGNAAILTNVCILPLYPGLIAYLAGNADSEQHQRAAKWLGLIVFLGVLTLMTAVGALLYLLQQSFGGILTYLLPIIYAVVIIMGILMLLGKNPFKSLNTVQTPLLKNPYIGAYVYGILLGPMTLPCAGPLVVSAFALGAGSVSSLSSSLLYFFAFGLGFGWPLILLPLIAIPFQRSFTKWMTRNSLMLTRLSGVLLIIIGLVGIYYELIPTLL